MAYMAKCPICGRTKKLDSKVKYFFRCNGCNMAIELKPNVIGKSFVLPRKEEEMVKIIDD